MDVRTVPALNTILHHLSQSFFASKFKGVASVTQSGGIGGLCIFLMFRFHFFGIALSLTLWSDSSGLFLRGCFLNGFLPVTQSFLLGLC